MATGLQRLRAHVNALEIKHTKLERMLAQEQANLYPDPDRIEEIAQAKTKIREQINLLEQSITKAVKGNGN
jgi:hypothetical protein